MSLIHATCVALFGRGVLIRGPSGAGKSDLALRLVDDGAELVADDYCEAVVRDGQLVVSAAPRLNGKIEMRGYGIVRLPHREFATIALVVDLMPETAIARIPDTDACSVEGVQLPWLALDALSASAAAKVRLALRGTLENLRVTP